jgi:hypothetical protein
MKIISIVEIIDNKIHNITNYVLTNNDDSSQIKTAEEHYLGLIQENTLPVILDDNSISYWLDKKIYINHNKHIEMLSGDMFINTDLGNINDSQVYKLLLQFRNYY